ncbi:MAG TPA: DUF916 domain-containing protein, partial [Chloroflexia bacterium]|nr:DUF916 domain-containing protein [Chloroflexia bacterium]
MRSLILASLLIIFSFPYALPSHASGQVPADEMGFGIAPVPVSDPSVTANGYFVYKLQSSASITGSVMLKNPGSKPLTIQLAAVDAMTAQGGGSAFAASEVAPEGVATWLKFAESSVTLPAGMQKPIDFTVRVPQSAGPGQYLAGISAYIANVPPTAGAAQDGDHLGASVAMQMRYVIGVQVDIEGAWTPSLKVDSVALVEQPSGPFIGVHMKNDGNMFLKPSGTIVMTNTAGRRVLDQPIMMGTFVPATEVMHPVRWSGVLASGTYQVQVSLDYDKDGKEVYTSELEVKPASAPQDKSVAAQEPGTIGSSGPQANVNTPTQPTQAGAGMWVWVAAGMGLLLLAVMALLALNLVKMRRPR